MPDAFPKTAGVALIPCYNEGRNPVELSDVAGVPDLHIVFIDDGSTTKAAPCWIHCGRNRARRSRRAQSAARWKGRFVDEAFCARSMPASIGSC